MDDAYFNSDNQADLHDLWVADEEDKERREMIQKLEWDHDRYPLPVCFDEYGEAKAFYLRSEHIREVVVRWQNIRRIRFDKKYKSTHEKS